MNVRIVLAIIVLVVVTLGLAAYSLRSPTDIVWGKRGAEAGAVVRPRAAVLIDDTIYLVDFTARIQTYDLDGHHTGLTFTTPDYRNGRPSGLGVDNQGRLMVADSHYHCVRIYNADGTVVKTLDGDFGYVSDCVQDDDGFYYISEFGQRDRITKLDPDGKVVAHWGESGSEPGQLLRARALAFGPDGNLYVADACNHRIQVFTKAGQFVKAFGSPGDGLGELSYPYDLAFAPDGSLYVVERGNCRVQKFDRNGTAMATWGAKGRKTGQLADPWAVVVDRSGRVHVVDTENHRVQRVKF